MKPWKLIRTLLFLVIAGVSIYAYRGQLENAAMRLTRAYFPCEQPITYRLLSFDKRFGISKADFLSAIKEAETIWEKPIGRELFTNAPNGNLNISLIYDYRQQATVKLRSLGLAIDGSRASYDALKAKYEALRADYEAKKSAYDASVEAFTKEQDAYNQEVAQSNARGGARRAEYDRLTAEQHSLEAEVEKIRQAESALNADIDNINALVVVLNRQAAALNLNVGAYNEIGASRGREFDEGVYKSGPEGEAIEIYQFDDRAKLVQVLAHELGHALGLPHIDDSDAIMYRLNQGENKKLSAEDLAALKALCRIE